VKALQAKDVEHTLQHSRGARVDEDVAAKFKPGDRVLTRNLHPIGHTRLPRYARARQGTITCDYGVFIFPDTHSRGEGVKAQHLYSVRFSARELWGPEAREADGVYLDLWDDYLDPAPGDPAPGDPA
jgi:nitrile hydratase